MTPNYRTALHTLVMGVLLLGAAACAPAGSLLRDWIIKNSDPIPRVITNLPEEFIIKYVLPPDIGARRRGLIEYLTLDDVGDEAANILPYDWEKRYHTIIVVDSSQLSAKETAKLALLRKTLFPRETLDPNFNTFWLVQNAGPGAGENFRVLVVAPAEKYVRALLEELARIDASELRSGSGDVLQAGHNVTRMRVITNAPAAMKEIFELGFSGPYDELTVVALQDREQVIGEPPTHEFVCLDWNGETEITFDDVAALMPRAVRDRVAATETNRMGLTGWQAECRRLVIMRDPDVVAPARWYIAAPTQRHLARLVAMTIEGLARGEELERDEPVPVDLTDAERIAVGVYLVDAREHADRIVVQHKLDDLARQTLPVAVASSEDLGTVLTEVLGGSADSPFRVPSGAERIVSATNADYLLLLWAQSLRPEQQYTYDKQRLTPPLEPFTLAEPSRPSPNDRKLFGGYVYPGATEEERRNSEKYRRALDNYFAEHDEWEQQKRIWEEQLYGREVQYHMRVATVPTVQLEGYLKLVDLTTRQVIWSHDLSVTNEGQLQHIQDIPCTVRGEKTEPPAPPLPPTVRDWDDVTYQVGREALNRALAEGLKYLLSDGLFREDLRAWNRGLSEYISSREFRLVHADGTETMTHLGQPSLRVLTANQGAVTVDAEQLQSLTPQGDEVRLVLLDGTEIIGRPTEMALGIVDAGGPRRISLSSVQTLVLAGGNEEDRVEGSGVLLSLTLTDGSTVSGEFMDSAFVFDAGILGRRELMPHQIATVRRDGEQWTAVLADGSTLRGNLATASLRLRVGDGIEERAAENIVSIQAAAPPELPRWTVTCADGSTRLVHLTADTVDFMLTSGMHLTVPTASIAEVRSVGNGEFKVQCTDGNTLIGRFAVDQPPFNAVDNRADLPLSWADVALIQPGATSGSEQIGERQAHRQARTYSLRHGHMERRGNMLCLPLRDMFEMLGVDLALVSATSYQGNSVCSFPWDGATIRVRAGEAAVFVNGQRRPLTVEVYGTDRLYVPADLLEVGLGLEIEVDAEAGVIRCTTAEEVIAITGP